MSVESSVLPPRLPGGASQAGNGGASERLARTFRAEVRAGQRTATRAYLITIGVITVWLLVQIDPGRVGYWLALLAGFAAINLASYLLGESRYHRDWHDYVFIALNFALLAYAVVVPNPFVENWPTQMRLRFGNSIYFLLAVAPVALTYSPRLMLWAGFCGAAAWSAGVAWIFSLPGTITWLDQPAAGTTLTATALRDYFLDPAFVDLAARIQDVIVILLLSGVLAAVVWRSRRLVMRQAAAARERANLARHFPPNIVDRLADLDKPLGEVRSQTVAVLFADIVGFTRLSEGEPPGQVVGWLREFHARMERAVFDHGGTLDKFLGDGVMATFGTPETGPRDAANAVACARAMLADIEDWNATRRAAGAPAIPLSVGIHHGTVVLGDIGSARRLEFAVLGDVVNVASRLEALTRELNCRAVVSDAVVDEVRREVGDATDELLAGFRAAPPQTLRGRAGSVDVWLLGDTAQAA